MAEINKTERGTVDRGLGRVVRFVSPRPRGPQGVVIHGQKVSLLEEDVPIVGKVKKDAKVRTAQTAKRPQSDPVSPRSVPAATVSPPPLVKAEPPYSAPPLVQADVTQRRTQGRARETGSPLSPPPPIQAEVGSQHRDTVRDVDGQTRGISEESRTRERGTSAATSAHKTGARGTVDQEALTALVSREALTAPVAEGGGSPPDYPDIISFSALNAKANAAIVAVAHGVTDAALNIGGSAAVGLGLSTEDEYEEMMLKFRLAGLSYDQTLVDAGGKALDIYLQYRAPGPEYPYRGPTTIYLDGKLGALATKSLQRASRIGQEAHRQTLKYKYPKWVPEVTLELIPGVVVRKDALRLTNKGAEVLIIKPDTETGRILAERRAQLVKDAGYLPKIELYDPLNPDFRPDSGKYIGTAE